MMLYHNIMRSDSEKVAKNILIEQKKWRMEKCLYSEIRESGLKTKVDIGNIIKSLNGRKLSKTMLKCM